MRLTRLSIFNAYLLRELFAGESCSELKSPDSLMQSIRLAKNMLNVSPYSYIALNETGPVGICQLIPEPKSESIIAIGLMIRPEQRLRGYGGQLLDTAILQAEIIGGKAVTGDTDVTNTACIGLFRSRGFTVSETHAGKVFFNIKDI